MLSPNMKTPLTSFVCWICVGVEIARWAPAQEPSTPDPYGPVDADVVAANSVDPAEAVVADAVSAEAETVAAAAAAAPTVKICRRLGFICLTGELWRPAPVLASPDLTVRSRVTARSGQKLRLFWQRLQIL
jgi:hypothetical protein